MTTVQEYNGILRLLKIYHSKMNTDFINNRLGNGATEFENNNPIV